MVAEPPFRKQPLVLIAPAYGATAVKRRWHDTMDDPVAFEDPRIAEHLSDAEHDELRRHHPEGAARFWRATRHYDNDMDQLTSGDLILFTGEKHLLAVGTLGFRTRSAELADALWPPDSGQGGWVNVYTVTDLVPVLDIDYPELASYLGYSPNYSFQPTKILTPEQAAQVITGVGLDSDESGDPDPARRSGITAGLDRAAIEETIAEWHQVGREVFLDKYGDGPAAKYVIIDRDAEIDALAILRGARNRSGLSTEGPWRGDRINVAIPLRKLGFAVGNVDSDLEGPLGAEPHDYLGRAAEFIGPTERQAVSPSRREQSFLRGALGIGTGRTGVVARCALCGRTVPEDLLVAAHIKPRSVCTEEERLDIPNVAMPACLLGCDVLYGRGYITVDGDGIIRIGRHVQRAALPACKELVGHKIAVDPKNRAGYFAWHYAKYA